MLGLSLTIGARCLGSDSFGGSLALTSDYFVRGITRTNDLEALQLDLHVVDSSGLLAGLFASNTQMDPYEPRNAEFNGYVGFAWSGNADWHGRILGSYYAYAWNAVGSRYNYGEVDVDVGYRDWLDVGVSYSPDAPRFTPHGPISVSAESVELNLQHPLIAKLSAVGGIGYDDTGGTGYVYWSVGVGYDLAPVTLAVSYVDTTAGAKTLFFDNAATGRWTGTLIWRF